MRSLENKLAGFVEGTFSRVFRSEVRPVEIARKLAREMEDHQSSTLSSVYVPHEFRVYLSRRDRARFASYEDALADELASYLLEHARRERFALAARPVIEFETDDRLGLGQFGIQAGVVRQPDRPRPPAYEPELRYEPQDEYGFEPDYGPPEPSVLQREHGPEDNLGGTMMFAAGRGPLGPPHEGRTVRNTRALVVYAGARLVLGAGGGVIGRSRDCEVVVSDPNVSRRHAELRPSGSGGWLLTDLGSTNGTRLNGREVRGSEPIVAGDEIALGSSVMTFEVD
ncbi:MAG: FhaA domain-containing protein [Solirubrobacteraceae bacterium]